MGKASKVKLKAPPTKNKPGHEIEVSQQWTSPSRIWKPKPRSWYLSSAAIILTVILLVTVMRYPSYQLLIIALAAFAFMWFIHGTVPPVMIEHKITSQGVYTYGELYHWDTIFRFWFSQKDGQYLLMLDLKRNAPERRLMLLLEDKSDTQPIFNSLLQHIKYANVAESEYNFVSKAIYGEYLDVSLFLPDLDDQTKNTPNNNPINKSQP